MKPSLSLTKRDINQVYPTTEPTHFLLLFCNSLPKIVLITSDVNSGVTMYWNWADSQLLSNDVRIDLRYGDWAARITLWQGISSPDPLIQMASGKWKLTHKGSAPFLTLWRFFLSLCTNHWIWNEIRKSWPCDLVFLWGGVTSSISQVFFHFSEKNTWDSSFDIQHICRSQPLSFRLHL